MTVTVEYPMSAAWNSTNGLGGPSSPMVRYTGPLMKGQKNPNEALNHPPNPDPATLTGQFTLAPVTVGAYGTVDYSLAAVMNQLPLPIAYCSIRIQYSGAPGSMIAQVSSVDAKQDLVVDAKTMNEGDGWAGSGANPWHLDANTQSILFLTDESDKPARIGFSATVGSVHYYLTSLRLAPHETRAIDIRQLRDTQVADFKKNQIPADGSVNWVRIDNVAVSGLVVVISRSGAIASSYDCCYCSCSPTFAGVNISPYSIDLVPNGYVACSCVAVYQDCNGNSTYTDETGGASWWSSNASVAGMDGSVAGQVDGYAAGSATIYASWQDCTYDQSGGPCYCQTQTSTGTASCNVVDATPVITGIDPSVWPAGQTTQVTITGICFGTNAPTLGFSPGSGISYTLSSHIDTQIVAQITVAAGTPNEEVDVTVTNNGYGGLAFNGGLAGESATSAPAHARVNAPLGSPEITVVAWINGSAPDLNPLPSGADSSLINDLANNCTSTLSDWLVGFRVGLGTSADVAYANAWLVKNSANAAPPNTITPSSYKQTVTNFRLFNDFGGASGGLGSYQIGTTPNPCHSGPQFLIDWIGEGEGSQYNGTSGVSPSGEIYQLVEGRIGFVGQRISKIVNNGRTVPWVWSVIELDSNGNPTYSNVAMFPTYSVYENGTLVHTYDQSSVADFVAKDQTYQLTPSQIP